MSRRAESADSTGRRYGQTPVDPESLELHVRAAKILTEQGKGDDYSDDEYIAALTQAAS